jgi:hypothetical protein
MSMPQPSTAIDPVAAADDRDRRPGQQFEPTARIEQRRRIRALAQQSRIALVVERDNRAAGLREPLPRGSVHACEPE